MKELSTRKTGNYTLALVKGIEGFAARIEYTGAYAGGRPVEIEAPDSAQDSKRTALAWFNELRGDFDVADLLGSMGYDQYGNLAARRLSGHGTTENDPVYQRDVDAMVRRSGGDLKRAIEDAERTAAMGGPETAWWNRMVDKLRSKHGRLSGVPREPRSQKANEQLRAYGYTVGSDGHFYRGDKRLSVKLEQSGKKFQATSPEGRVLWSGPDVALFVQKFWNAQPTACRTGGAMPNRRSLGRVDDEDDDDDDEFEDEEDFEDEEGDDEAPDEDELREAAVIEDARRGGGYAARLERKSLGTFEEFDEAVDALVGAMNDEGYFPNLYYVNERGNVDLLDRDGSILKSWV